jgi:cobalt-zinc-cadmium efflux system outer membrane protein
MKSIFWLSLLSLNSSASVAMTLQELDSRMAARNPELRAAQESSNVLKAQGDAATAWPAPTVSYIAEKDPSGVPGVDPENKTHWNIQQMIPFPGKRRGESNVKWHESRIAHTKALALEQDLRRQVHQRVYQLWLADRKIELAQQGVLVLQSVLRSAQARLASGQASASEVFLTQTELRQMENELFEQQQNRKLVQIELNTLLNDPPDQAIPSIAPPERPEAPGTLAELIALADRHNPDLAINHHEVSHGETMLRLSRLSYAPDFGLFLERETKDQGPAGRQIGLSLTVPIWLQGPRHNVAAARAHIDETKAMVTEREAMVRRMVALEQTEVETRIAKAKLYKEGIVPSAEHALSAIRQQYASGRADYLRFLEAFRSWLRARSDYADEVYHIAEHWTELERWVGISLPYEGESGRKGEGERPHDEAMGRGGEGVQHHGH